MNKFYLALFGMALSVALIFLLQPSHQPDGQEEQAATYKRGSNTGKPLLDDGIGTDDIGKIDTKPEESPEGKSINRNTVFANGEERAGQDENLSESKKHQQPAIVVDKELLEKHHVDIEKSIVEYGENLHDRETRKKLESQLKNATEYREMMLQHAKSQM